MRKFDELTKEDSCLNRAEDDEPLFVLRANDEIAPGLVRKWAEMYAKTKSRQRDGMSKAQLAKLDEAMQLADEMDKWRQSQPT